MQNVVLPLDTRIDTDSYDITQKNDSPAYKYKDSLVFNGVLSNLKYKESSNFPTTTGTDLALTLTGSAIEINGRTVAWTTDKCIRAKTKIEPPISGEIIDIGVQQYGSGRTAMILYIIKSNGGFYLCGRLAYFSSNKYTFTEYEPIYICDDDGNHAAFILKCATNADYVKPYYSEVESSTSGTTTTRTHKIYQIIPDFDNATYTSALRYTKTMTINESVSYYKNFYLSGPINNGARVGSNYIFGADYNDQRKCWCFNNANSPIEFFGCVDEEGMVSGEPIPHLSDAERGTLWQVYEMPNGVLRWQIAGVGDTVEYNVNALIAPTSYSDTKTEVFGKLPKRVLTSTWYAGYNIGNAISVKLPNCSETNTIYDFTWTINDPTQDFGDLGQSGNSYNSIEKDVFPNTCIFTNKRYNRGKIYDYGKGYSRFILQQRGVDASASTTADSRYSLTTDARPFIGKTNVYDVKKATQNVYPLDVGGKYSVVNSAADSSIINAFLPNDNEAPADSSVWASLVNLYSIMPTYGRLVNLTETNIKNNTYPTLCYSIGGNIDDGFINSLPTSQKLTDDIRLQRYNGLPVSISYNHCLIATPSDEIEHYTWTIQESAYTNVVIDKEVFFIESIGVNLQNVHIEKVADYVFKTNLLVENNFIKENRDGTLDYVRGANPYCNECEINNDLVASLDIYMPNSGSSANDAFLLGAGCNTNLDDKSVSASYLLPAVNVPIYVDSSDIDKFNQEVINNRNPLIAPYIVNLFASEEVDVYFTHNLASTDVTYKTTYIRNDVAESTAQVTWTYMINESPVYIYTNSWKDFSNYKTETFKDNLADNSWWLTAEIIIFPIAIGSSILGANYVTPTIELDSNYTAQLYNKNNVTFLVFNSAQQVYYGNQIFTIYTNSYYYDGQAIYYIGGTNQLTQNEFVCYALGMQFLCNSGTEAYFWSDWEKKLYVFTGSNTMQAADSFSKFDDLLDSVYSSKEQALYLLFSYNNTDEDDYYNGYNRYLVCRTQKDSFMVPLTVSDDVDISLNTTADGVALVYVRDNKSVTGYYSFKPHSFDNIMPLHLETEWIGDDGTLTKYSYIDVMLYKITDEQKIDITVEIRNGDETKTETVTYELSTGMWKSKLYRMRVTPKDNIGTSFRVIIHSDDLAAVSYISAGLEPTSNIPGAPMRRN